MKRLFAALIGLVASAVLGRVSAAPGAEAALGFAMTNVAREAGLTAVTVFGGRETNKYLLETTGCGAAFLDYDNDGWLDAFLVNGTTLEGFPKGQEPTNHLYRNKGDGTFEDVTAKAGLGASGWGQGVCAGDYDNDGFIDLAVTYWGQNRLYRNRGDGTFEDVTAKAGLLEKRTRWGTGCAFVDYDRDTRLDLFVANYIDMDLATTPTPDTGLCRYKGIPVACGPPGLVGGKNVLYHNDGDGRFSDVSEKAGITRASGTYGLGVSTLDFDGDGWADLYVANDSNPNALYRNNHDGTFTDLGVRAGCAYSQDGKPQAGMGVAIGDYDRSGTLDVFVTNFAGDTSTLHANPGDGFCEDRTFMAGIGVNTRFLGWGVGFADFENRGWLDLFLVNGHVYPEVEQLKTEAGYKQRKVVYRNRTDGRFEDVSERLGPPVTDRRAGRGAAFGDYDNDGAVDVLVNNVYDPPDLFRTEARNRNHWITLRLEGTRSNRSAIGARVRSEAAGLKQVDEVRGGGSYLSQNDLRVHFGLAEAARVDRLEVRWPNGLEEEWRDLAADRIVTLKEGTGTPGSRAPPAKRRPRPRRDRAIEAGMNSQGASVVRLRVVRLVLCILCVLCVSVASWSQPAEDQPTTAITEARALLNRGQAAAAIQKLLPQDHRDPRVAELLGVAYYQADDPVRAIDLLTPIAAKLDSGSLEEREASQVLGLSLYLVGRLPEAIPYLEKTRAWATDNIELLNVLGNAYVQTQKPDRAREVFARLFRVAPDSAAAHLLAGQMMVRLEFEEMANAELEAAIAKDPRLPQARYLLAQSAIFRARFDEATRLLEKELEVNPGNAMALYRLGEALSRQNKWDEATAALQKSIWLQPYFSGPYIVLGRAYMKKGQPATAEGMLRRAIEYDPNNKSAHYLLGQLLQQAGREDEAKRELDLAERLQGEPDHR